MSAPALPINAYFQGKLVPYADAKVGVATHAFNYGTAIFGGLRAYWNDEQQKLRIFRPIEHYQRFLNSAKIMAMELGQTPESLTQITKDLLQADGRSRDLYIRPLAYKADEGIGVRLHNLKDELTIFALPFDKYVQNDTNAHVTVSAWRRVDDNSIPGRGKISGAYASSALAKTDAARAGFDEALLLTQDGHVAEGSAMNIFMLRDGKLITPPVTDNILEGITRRSIIELAEKELNLHVVERSIDRSELFLCDEFFMTGTAAQVMAVTKIDHRVVGNGVMGPVTSEIRTLFDDIVRGRVASFNHWLTEVPQPETVKA